MGAGTLATSAGLWLLRRSETGYKRTCHLRRLIPQPGLECFTVWLTTLAVGAGLLLPALGQYARDVKAARLTGLAEISEQVPCRTHPHPLCLTSLAIVPGRPSHAPGCGRCGLPAAWWTSCSTSPITPHLAQQGTTRRSKAGHRFFAERRLSFHEGLLASRPAAEAVPLPACPPNRELGSTTLDLGTFKAPAVHEEQCGGR